MNAVLISTDEPPRTVEVVEEDGGYLAALQALVGGMIEALPFPGRHDVTTYVNEEGKLIGLPVNRLATSLMGPSLFPGDVIVGPLVVCGFDPRTGENHDLPDDVGVQIDWWPA